MQSQKQETARKLTHDVSRLTADIQEVERRRLALKKKRGSPVTSGGQRRVATGQCNYFAQILAE